MLNELNNNAHVLCHVVMHHDTKLLLQYLVNYALCNQFIKSLVIKITL